MIYIVLVVVAIIVIVELVCAWTLHDLKHIPEDWEPPQTRPRYKPDPMALTDVHRALGMYYDSKGHLVDRFGDPTSLEFELMWAKVIEKKDIK